MEHPQILIVDLGSQYTSLIARRLRELQIRSATLTPSQANHWLEHHEPNGIILSGSDASVYDEHAPAPPKAVLECDVPILGICYGMQWLVNQFERLIESTIGYKEYAAAEVTIDTHDPLFLGVSEHEHVWASHGDSLSSLPAQFKAIALSAQSSIIAGLRHTSRPWWGVQFHLEVHHTTCGRQVLRNFIFSICQCAKDWQPANMVTSIQTEITDAIGNERAIIGFSGGVDSTTLACIAAGVLEDRLTGICVNAGQLREGELDEIKQNARHAGVTLCITNTQSHMLRALQQVKEGDVVREIFARHYTRTLETEARIRETQHILQGSLAPDFIESGKMGEAAFIKQHHNVLFGIHPLRNLFKDEVRELATHVGLPEEVVTRQPFPGPGLYIRIIGAPPTIERLNILRWADKEVRHILHETGIYDTLSQLSVSLLCTPLVGIKGDARVLGDSVIVHGVTTQDFMTAEGYAPPPDIQKLLARRVTKHPRIVSLMIDPTDKPPKTIEPR